MGKKKRRTPRRQKAPSSAPAFPAWMLALFLFLLGAGLYWNTLSNEFVFDDTPLITQNLQVTEYRWGEMLGLTTSYRPVRTLTYALNYAWGGEDPWGYHLFNILLHALNGVLLFRLLMIWTQSLPGSACGALLFLVHPVQTEAVAYVSGRKDLLAALFILIALLVYMRYRREGGKLRLAAIFLLFALGALSKEVALVFPALLLIVDALVPKPSQQSITQRRRGAVEGDEVRRQGFLFAWFSALRASPWIPAGAVIVSAAGIYYALFIVEASRMVGFWGGSFATNLGTSFKLFAHYLKLAVWPHPLIADYTGEVFAVSQGFLEPATLLAIMLSIAYLAGAIWVYRWQPLVSAGMFWFLVTLLPVLQLIPFHELAADRFLYQPLVGVALIAAALMQKAVQLGRLKRVAWAGVAVLAVACSVRTVDRNRDWSDQQTLWEATYASAPDSFRANTNLGRIYFEEGKSKLDYPLLRKGMAMTRRALDLVPGDSLATANLGGMILETAGLTLNGHSPEENSHFANRAEIVAEAERLTQKALGLLEKALQENPYNGAVINNIGNCYKRFGAIWDERGDEKKALENRLKAREEYEQALARDPRKEQKATWYNYAMLYVDVGMHQEAVNKLENFLKYFPNHPDGNARMGISLMELKRPAEAAGYFEKASRYQPTLDNLAYWAQAHHQAGQLEAAIRVYQILIRQYPEAYAGYYNLGLLYKQSGNRELAKRLFEVVVAKSPDPNLINRARQELQLLSVKVTAEDVPR